MSPGQFCMKMQTHAVHEQEPNFIRGGKNLTWGREVGWRGREVRGMKRGKGRGKCGEWEAPVRPLCKGYTRTPYCHGILILTVKHYSSINE